MRARRNRGRRFRVELYIDALDQNKTKRIFDQIYQHKDMLESVLGDVSWERIDDKRASRIAQYCPGDIGDDATALASLRDWAAAKMIAFYEALEPLAMQAINEVMNS